MSRQRADEFDLNGNNWVIKDTPFDHLTKLNFKQTIREMNIFNVLKERNGLSEDFRSNNLTGGKEH